MATHPVETIPEMETRAAALPGKPDSGRAAVTSILESLLEPVEQGVIILDRSRTPVYSNRCARGILSASTDEEIAGIIERSCPDSLFEKCSSSGSAVTYVDVTLPTRRLASCWGLRSGRSGSRARMQRSTC